MKRSMLLIIVFLFAGAFMLTEAQTVNITFSVDMSVQKAKGAFNPVSDQVQLHGDFDGWGSGIILTGDADNKVYSGTVTGVAASSTINYKFVYVSGGTTNWEGDPNRTYTAGTSDSEAPVDYFNRETPPSGDPAMVTFVADMRLPIRKGLIDVATDQVSVAGDFNGWNTSADIMTDTDGDSLYTAEVDTIKSGTLIHYKFIYTHGANVNYETTPDQTYFVLDSNNTVQRFWENTDPNVTLADGNIRFNIDLAPMEELGFYNGAADSVRIRGGFNGWSDSPVEKSQMYQDAIVATQWYISVPFDQEPLHNKETYKFYYVPADASSPFTGDQSYERPLSTGGGNREVIFNGESDQNNPVFYFNDIYPGYIIPSGQSVSITFSVDMTPALTLASVSSSRVFNPDVDTVYWSTQQQAFAVTMGAKEGDNLFKMERVGSSMIYQATMTVNGPSFNGFLYYYSFSNADDGKLDEDNNFDEITRRVRYISMTGPNAFVQPYSAPQDTWSLANKEDQFETHPGGYDPTSVQQEKGVLPSSFSISQNYPNPFNPTTKIKFAIPEASSVKIKVYNILGQEVSTVLNQEMKSGSYEVDFNGAKLSSGVYFYTITAGKYTATKKMLLLK